MNRHEWQTVHYYQSCLEAAERCGLKIKQAGSDDKVGIVATKSPYADGTCLIYVNGFYAALCWIQGYEQRIFEVKNT